MLKNPARILGLFGLIAFPAVGLLFLTVPQSVLSFFNVLSVILGLKPSLVTYPGFYLILTAAYMYMVSFLSYRIFRDPANPVHLLLLAHAKIASAILSLVLILLDHFYLLYAANSAVDGLIGVIAWRLFQRARS